MPLGPGTRLGPYEILSAIGAGGMGEVYRATDTNLGRQVAIKVLPEAFAQDAERVARFEREAKTLASLNHPNIAIIHGLEKSSGTYALVMELVDGEDLSQRIARGPIPIGEALPIAKQIAEALEAAHEQGIIHRDLKPANIKVTPDGVVKVLDFGLAKLAEPSASHTSELSLSPTITSPALMTGVGVLIGTAAYMSPEQARGKTASKRSDVWAFGCVLYEMLTGRPVFEGEQITEVLAAVLERQPDSTRLPSQTSPSVRRLLRRCLQKNPKERLADIADARLELLEESHVAALPDFPSRLGWRRLASVVMTAAAIALAVFLGMRWNVSSAQPIPRWHGELLGGSAIAMGPRVSPDGQLVAFQAMVDGLTQVAVMKPQSGNWTVLTRERNLGQVTTISWSPDGTKLFFDRFLNVPRGVFSVPVLGGDEQLITEDAMAPEALPDGSLIVTRINQRRNWQLFHFRRDTNQLEALPAWLPAAGLLSTAVRVFPDGREAVFVGRSAEEDQTAYLHVINLQSHRVRRISPPLYLSALYWFPLAVTQDGNAALIDSPAGNLHQIIAIPRDGRGEVRPVVTLTSLPLWIDVARDGSLYLDQVERPAELLRFDPRSKSVDRMPAPSRTELTALIAALPLPDGRVILSRRLLGRDQLVVLAAGKDPVPFVATDEETGGPLALVGNDRVAFIEGSGAGQRVAFASVMDGRVLRRLNLRDSSLVQSLAVTPDGETLYYVASRTVFAASLDGNEAPKAIRTGDGAAVDPTGKYLLILLNETSGVRLVQRSIADGREQPLALPPDLRLAPIAWGANVIGPDGRLAVRLAPKDSWFWPAAIFDPATGRVDLVPSAEQADMVYPTWTRDGRLNTLALLMRANLWRLTPEHGRP